MNDDPAKKLFCGLSFFIFWWNTFEKSDVFRKINCEEKI